MAPTDDPRTADGTGPSGSAPSWVDGIDLEDGTWVDVGADGRWRPSPGERVRAAVILLVVAGVLGVLALAASLGGGDGDPVAAATTTSTTTEPTTTTTTAPPDPSSLDGEPASARCSADDRSALPLRDRQASTVLVLNGTRRNGLAGATTEDLEARGYSTVVPGNAGFEPGTEVAYKLGFCAEAERLAADLGVPGADVVPFDGDTGDAVAGRARIVVTLGEDSL